MVGTIKLEPGILLEDYNLHPALAMGLRELKTDASALVGKFERRKLWHVNSTSEGGGVAEMLPREINLLRQLGVQCDWVVATTEETNFFIFTKKLHNLIHGTGNEVITHQEIAIYEEVSRINAIKLDELVNPNDIVVFHDPQPMGMAMHMKTKGLKFIWRCHIGTQEQNAQTKAAWNFLKKYEEPFERAVFSASEYIPSCLTGISTVIAPYIDPLSEKNKELSVNEVTGILCNARLLSEYHPVMPAEYADTAKRLRADGIFASPLLPTDMGLLFKQTILQVSRWDKLKGFLPLMKGYTELRSHPDKYAQSNPRNLKRIELSHLVLAGPDPGAVSDDPEEDQMLNELISFYTQLPPEIQDNISIIKLPMVSHIENDLMVNALQRTATIIVQNSIKEGFGLTVTEAMWKAKPVIGTTATGIQQQMQNEIHGVIINNPEDPKEIAEKIAYTLNEDKRRKVWALNGQKRVNDQFLIFSSLRQWLQLFAAVSAA